MRPSHFARLLYLISVLTDFSGFVVVFAVSRGLAEAGAEPWYLGLAGAGLSLTVSVSSILSGLLANRFDSRAIFVLGAVTIGASAVLCGLGDSSTSWFLPRYWLLGAGLGFVYPPLIAWLNRGTRTDGDGRDVSRRVILFCVAWNTGMMAGQLTAGSLFEFGPKLTFLVAFAVAAVNALLVGIAARALPVVHEDSQAEVSTPAGNLSAERATRFKRLSWIANLGGMFGGSLVIHLLPDLAVSIGIEADRHGSLLACWRAVIIATYLLMHLTNFWHFLFRVSSVSQALGALGLIVISLADSAATCLVGLALLGQLVGFNYFSGLFYSTMGSPQPNRALAAGLHEGTLAAGMACGTILGGVLGSLFDQRLPYQLAALLLFLLLALQSAICWRWRRNGD